MRYKKICLLGLLILWLAFGFSPVRATYVEVYDQDDFTKAIDGTAGSGDHAAVFKESDIEFDLLYSSLVDDSVTGLGLMSSGFNTVYLKGTSAILAWLRIENAMQFSANDGLHFIIENFKNQFDVDDKFSGEGGAIHAHNGAAFLNGTYTFRNNNSSNGGGAIYSGNDLVFHNGTYTFSNNIAGSGGGAINSYGGITFQNGTYTFSNNSAGLGGGAIYVWDAMTLLEGTYSFTGNTSAASGGAIFSANGIIFSGGTYLFENNKSAYEGGAINNINGSLNLLNGDFTFKNNTAINPVDNLGGGGAIRVNDGYITFAGNGISRYSFEDNYAGSVGGAIYASRSITFNNSYYSFVGNQALYNGVAISDERGNGGAIYAGNGAIFNDGIYLFNNNSATNSGGAIFSIRDVESWGDGLLLFKNGVYTFENNRAMGITAGIDARGGAIYANEVLTFENGVYSFKNNQAGELGDGFSAGGAIYAEGPLTFHNGVYTFHNNSTVDSLGRGGAVYAWDTLVFNAGEHTFTDNLAQYQGGAIFAMSGIRFNNGTYIFSNNQAAGNGGGAVYAADALTFAAGQYQFNNNQASQYGGALYAAGDLAFHQGTYLFDNNHVSGASALGNHGGAICADSDLLFHNGQYTFSNNSATDHGGAIHAGAAAAFIDGSYTFTNNQADYGGALYVSDELTFTAGTYKFQNNRAGNSHSGGAIYAGAQLVFTNGNYTFTGNQAEQGGAIYADDDLSFNAGTYKFENNLVSGNTGGAIYADAGLAFLDGQYAFSNSSAQFLGGAIYAVDSISFANGTYTFQGNKVSGNSAISKVGGGALYSEGEITFTNGNYTFSANTAANGVGGAVYAPDTLSFIDGTYIFNANTSAGGGGALYAYGDLAFTSGTYTFGGAQAQLGNKAQDGGAIYAAETLIFQNGSYNFTHNQANNYGGAIYAEDNLIFQNGGHTFANNSARTYGGAIYANQGLSMPDGEYEFLDNLANSNGGAIYTAGTLSLLAGRYDFKRNASQYSGGGAIYLADGQVANFDNGIYIFDLNTAHVRGGAIYAGGTLNFIDGDYSFSRNKVDDGGGGAIYAMGMVNSPDGDYTFFSNSASESGGAIYAAGDVTLNGARYDFFGNQAKNGGAVYLGGGLSIHNGRFMNNQAAGGNGGAIYHDAATGNHSLKFNAVQSSEIRFSGNTHNSGAANSIYFANTSAAARSTGVELFVDPDTTLTMLDPLMSQADGQAGSLSLDLEKTGAGLWYLAGHNHMQSAANWRITDGTLRLMADTGFQGAHIDLAHATTSSFSLNAVLRLATANTSHQISGLDIQLLNGSKVEVEAGKLSQQTPALVFSSANSLLLDNFTVDALGMGAANGTFTLIDASQAAGTDFSGKVTGLFDGAPVYVRPNPRYGQMNYDFSETDKIKVNVADADIARLATWNGGGNWDIISENWVLEGSPYKFFKDGDSVVFSGNPDGTVTVHAQGVVVDTMSIDGGNYTFSPQTASQTGGIWGSELRINGGNAAFDVDIYFEDKVDIAQGGSLLMGPQGWLVTDTLNLAGGLQVNEQGIMVDKMLAGDGAYAYKAQALEHSGGIWGNELSVTGGAIFDVELFFTDKIDVSGSMLLGPQASVSAGNFNLSGDLRVVPLANGHFINAEQISFSAGSTVGVSGFTYGPKLESALYTVLTLDASQVSNQSTVPVTSGVIQVGAYDYDYQDLYWDDEKTHLVIVLGTPPVPPDPPHPPDPPNPPQPRPNAQRTALSATTAPSAIAAQNTMGAGLFNRFRYSFSYGGKRYQHSGASVAMGLLNPGQFALGWDNEPDLLAGGGRLLNHGSGNGLDDTEPQMLKQVSAPATTSRWMATADGGGNMVSGNSSLWFSPTYSHTNNRGISGYSLRTPTWAGGYEQWFDESFFLGLAVSGSLPEYESAHADISAKNISLAVYGGMRLPYGIEFGALASYGGTDYKQHRRVHGQTYNSDYESKNLGLGASLARNFALSNGLSLRPFANYEYLRLAVDGYNEGQGDYALDVDSHNENLHFIRAGLEATATSGDSGAHLTGRVYYAGIYGDRQAKTKALFTADPANPFTSAGDALDKHSLGLGVNVGLPLAETMELQAGYNFLAGEDNITHQGSISFVLKF